MSHSILIRPSLLGLCLAVALVGCGDDKTKDPVPTDDAGDTPDAAADTGMEMDSAVHMNLPALADLPIGEWSEMVPGGDTTCSDGSAYTFYVYRGTSKNLVVNFMGGGGCWNAVTCKKALGLYQPDASQVKDAFSDAVGGTPGFGGIFNMDDERNPVQNYTQVVVTYCTADVHWGDRSAEYGSGSNLDPKYTIEHKGAVNAKAVLDWVYDNVTDPNTTLTTGCSAGSYGAAMWSASVSKQYPDAHNVVLGDSGAGVLTDSFLMTSFSNWNATAAFPSWIEDFDVENLADPAAQDALPNAYKALAAEYPATTYGQFNRTQDGVQKTFYLAMGGNQAEWSGIMISGVQAIADDADNFHYFISAGGGTRPVGGDSDNASHCVIDSDWFYTETVDGTKVVDWLGDMIAGNPVDNVSVPL